MWNHRLQPSSRPSSFSETMAREAHSAGVGRAPLEGRVLFSKGVRLWFVSKTTLQCPSHPGTQLWLPATRCPHQGAWHPSIQEQHQVLRGGHLSCAGREVSKVRGFLCVSSPLPSKRWSTGSPSPSLWHPMALTPVLALGCPGTAFGAKGKGQLLLRFVAAPTKVGLQAQSPPTSPRSSHPGWEGASQTPHGERDPVRGIR